MDIIEIHVPTSTILTYLFDIQNQILNFALPWKEVFRKLWSLLT
jgi:hypothetical protein